GKFEIADQGTIFLDEIGVLPLNSQTKLLRVLQERTFERVGGTSQIPVDVRIIAATNLDLEKEVEKGNFRDDLYYRLNVVPLKMPPLRERKSDIPILVDHFLKIYNRKYAKQVKKLPDEVILHLENYDWPGNVRELENIIQRLLVISGDSEIALEQLPLELIARSTSQLGRQKSFNLKHAVNHFERDYIRRTLLKTNNVQKDAAQMLGIHRNTLMSKMKELNLAPKNI
ncbi:MAG: sigma-54-dependent Fis family transcriptional regulator, partial [Planctomycetes bacterium]|nr:sigma-54-dependent Fis family transcriptional regulator [Planctomycetota bacterium]